MESRAIHEIQSDAMRLIERRLKGAIECADWVAVHRCAMELEEIAQRGSYHASQAKRLEVTRLAMGNYSSEPEAR